MHTAVQIKLFHSFDFDLSSFLEIKMITGTPHFTIYDDYDFPTTTSLRKLIDRRGDYAENIAAL